MLHIVLVEPEIHTNTGNIGRLALATQSKLHLIEPLGFELSDRRLKRAGLDYWQHIDLEVHKSFKGFEQKYKLLPKALFTARTEHCLWDLEFQEEQMLIFGKESRGLDSHITIPYQDSLYKIPMYDDRIRSLNLANSVAITVYEGLRQLAIKNPAG